MADANPLLYALLVDGIIGGVGAVVGFLPLVMVMYFLGCNAVETVVVISHHDKVDVVVPWDESLVTDCSKQGASIEPKAQSVTLTDFTEL